MIKALLCYVLLLLVSATHGWVSRNYYQVGFSFHHPAAVLRMAGGDNNEIPTSVELETEDPCWQNMLDDDCSMGNIYAANFVASKWIKSMPCGEGIEASFHAASKLISVVEQFLTSFLLF